MMAKPANPEAFGSSPALAIVTAFPTPLVVLDSQLSIVAASVPFCELCGAGQADLLGRALYDGGGGQWGAPELKALFRAALAGNRLSGPVELRFERAGRPSLRLSVEARPLTDPNVPSACVLVAITDVTAARADERLKDDAMRLNAVLLQEVRHHVANKLQIVSSVLLRHRRDRGAGDLETASFRALERLLSTTQHGDVWAHTYFSELCRRICDTTACESDQISILVEGGEGVMEAKVAMGLGLIVTELVFNALEHGFPAGGPGRITVAYHFDGSGWMLSVGDDGVGMPSNGRAVRTGMGGNIVRALARQLDASVELGPAAGGARFCVRHARAAQRAKTSDGRMESVEARGGGGASLYV